MWYLCLYATRGTDLRAALRAGASRDELAAIITRGWTGRTDRGAEERLALGERRAVRPDQGPQAGPASRDAHSRRLTLRLKLGKFGIKEVWK